MDYTSSLGPIDPQIHNGKEFVPALGYLDQVEKMIQKVRSYSEFITDYINRHAYPFFLHSRCYF